MSPRPLGTPLRGLTRWQTPHLFGTVHYDKADRLRPDGDTIHLRDPVLLHAGKIQLPERGQLEITLRRATSELVPQARLDLRSAFPSLALPRAHTCRSCMASPE